MPLSSTEERIFFILEKILTYFSFTILFLGLIGNSLNIIIFLRHKFFHQNQCVFYLTAESIVDCVQLLITFTSRIGIIVFNYDPMQTSLTWCKIRSMIAPVCALISMTTVCFAVIDQYLSTHHNPRLRKTSTLQLAQTLMCLNVSIWLLYGISFLVFFGIRPSVGCAPIQLSFLRYYQFFHFPVLLGLLPMIIGSIFSVLAYRNVRRIVRRQISHTQRRLDRQLTAMVLARVTFLIIVTLPFVIDRIYSLLTSTSYNNSLRKAIENFIFNTTILIFTLNFSVRQKFLIVCLHYLRILFRELSTYFSSHRHDFVVK